LPRRYDPILGIVASHTLFACQNTLNLGGIYVTTEFSPALALQGLRISMSGDKKLVPFLAKPPSTADQTSVRELLEDGKLRPIIDRSSPLSEVPEALRYLADGHARGKIVITV
jgi:NADPH:quinone reductase-like Zn-dependent oxidoreductase